jgi:pyruvate-formate lyase-activating enzyme
MHILALYPNAAGYNRIPTGLALIMTCLSEAGHTLELFDTTFLSASNQDNDLRERAGLVKAVSSGAAYTGLREDELDEQWRQVVRASGCDVIIVSLVEDNYRFAHRLLGSAKGLLPSVVVIAGGATPSSAPEVVIANPHIDYLVEGEGEEAAVELCGRLERGLGGAGIANVWHKEGGTVSGTPVRAFVDMDALPFQDLRWWDAQHFLKPYDGKVYRTGAFESSRGCPFRCTYCINHTLQDRLRQAGRYFRRKSPARTVAEIKEHIGRHGLERIVFCDDNFLLMPQRDFPGFAEEFAALWKAEVGLPYWINTSADFIRPDTAAFLRETGCDGVGMGVEAGSEWFRRSILRRSLRDDRLVEAFAILHAYDIRTTANAMIGFPGESEEDILDTARLLLWIAAKSADVSFVSPYIGTDIHRAAASLGYIDVLAEPGFQGMARDVSFRGHSTIRNPNLGPERMSELYLAMNDYITGRHPIPPRQEEGNFAGPARIKVAETIKAFSR